MIIMINGIYFTFSPRFYLTNKKIFGQIKRLVDFYHEQMNAKLENRRPSWNRKILEIKYVINRLKPLTFGGLFDGNSR